MAASPSVTSRITAYYTNNNLQPDGPHKSSIEAIDAAIFRIAEEREVLFQKEAALVASGKANTVPSNSKDKTAGQIAKEAIELATDKLTYLRAKRTLLMPRDVTDLNDPRWREFYLDMDSNRDGGISSTEILEYFELCKDKRNSSFLRSIAQTSFGECDINDEGIIRGPKRCLAFYLNYQHKLALSLAQAHLIDDVESIGGPLPHADGSVPRTTGGAPSTILIKTTVATPGDEMPSDVKFRVTPERTLAIDPTTNKYIPVFPGDADYDSAAVYNPATEKFTIPSRKKTKRSRGADASTSSA